MITLKERFPIPNGSKAFQGLTSKSRQSKTLSPIAAHANWTGNLKEKLTMLYKLGLWLLDRADKAAADAGLPWQCYMGRLPSVTLPHPMVALTGSS